MILENGMGHLTYSTLVHPGDTWEEMWASLVHYVPDVKRRVSPNNSFGVSLRLSGLSAARLIGDVDERAKLRDFLADNDLYLFTVNAFPHGAFKGKRVKEQVYEPDWRTDQRAQYTMDVATILADLAVNGIEPSIQSAPCGFKPRVTGGDVVDAYTRQLLRVVAHLVRLEESTGKTVTLALEPEPACFLETAPETVTYFESRLYAREAIRILEAHTGLSAAQAETALRRHLGVVFDICHQAVQYEDMAESLRSLGKAGIPVLKLQAAAAVRIPVVDAASVAALAEYDDPVYLHQTVERRNGGTTHYVDLPDAFAAWRDDPGPREWRTHFHVPVFLDDIGPFKTTRPDIEDALRFHRASPVSAHVEIETYTWDVLPSHLKTGNITDYVVRELEWVRDKLIGPKGGAA